MKKLGIRRPAPPRLGSRLLSRELSVGLSVGSMSARQFAVSSLVGSAVLLIVRQRLFLATIAGADRMFCASGFGSRGAAPRTHTI
jgi:hypothetical protein